MSERNEKGQFEKGNSGNPAGRAPKARELAYLAVIAEEVTLDDFRQVIRKAKEDALKGEDGRTRDYGRRWLADYLIGRPRQTLHINTSPGTRDEFDELSDEELRAIIAAESAADSSSDSARDAEQTEADAGAGTRDSGGAHTATG